MADGMSPADNCGPATVMSSMLCIACATRPRSIHFCVYRVPGLSSGAGTLWSRRESGRLPPPGTQETIDTALESSRRGERSFVETKSSIEVVRARRQIWNLSANRHAG
eukprot:scaffold96840_cov66-Phaeocystis_antarctica.AAC.2